MNELAKVVTSEQKFASFIQGVKECIPTLVGYISIGIAMGVVGVSSNLSVIEVTLLSALVYGGASQFIICALLVAASPASVIIFTTFIVNLRHFLLCMTLSPHFTEYSLLKNVGIGALVTDESFGVAVNKIARKETFNASWMYGLNLTAYLSWIAACAAGAVFGKWISDPERLGLDFSLTAMFIALLVLQLQNVKHEKLKLYLSLIFYVVLFMFIFSLFVSSYIAILLSTMIAAAIGVLKSK